MRIEEIDGVKYHVVKEITSTDEDFVNRLSDIYKESYNNFVLLKAKPNPAVPTHHLICRRIDDVDFDEITEEG